MKLQVRDHIVKWRARENIISLAEARRDCGFAASLELDVCTFIERVVVRGGLSRTVKLRLFDAEENDDLAFVTYFPNAQINVDRKLWEEAEIGEPRARYMLAHEIGHADLHDQFAKAFSGSEDDYVKSVPPERSAEIQANLYADHLLVSDWVVQKLRDEARICVECGVEREVAARRIRDFRTEHLQALKVTGEYCGCGDLLFKRGERYICKNCFTY